MHSHHRSGVTLIELGIVLAVISVLVATALPGFRGWTAGFDVKDTSRAVADSFALARAEAIRTGNNHIVAINGTTIGATNPIEVANDGAPGTENCLIDAGETVHVVKSIPNVEWGTTSTLANGTAAPDDMGGSSGTIEDGWSFTDAGGVTSAQWVVFQADGIPHLFTPGGCVVGPAGAGGGGDLPHQWRARLRRRSRVAGNHPNPLVVGLGLEAVMRKRPLVPRVFARAAGMRAQAAGFSLLEVIVAIGILSFGLMALAVMQLEALSQGAAGKHSVDAAAVGRTYLEQVHRVPWTVLDAAVATGGFTNPGWAGAPSTFDVSIDVPGGATSIEHSYTIQWAVSDVGTSACLRDVGVRVSWIEPKLASPKTLDFATRRYNYGDPSC